MIKNYIILLGIMLTLTACSKAEVTDTEEKIQGDVEISGVIEETEQIDETQRVEETSSWVSTMALAQTTTQIVAVVEQDGVVMVSLHTMDENGIWSENFSVEGRIGKKGLGKTKEGDKKTPTGAYRFTHAFGILPDPGILALPYVQVDKSHRWVDDSNSKYYNQFVSTKEVKADWSSAERLYKSTYSYKYVLALNYNEACVPGAGSAVFLHCPSKIFDSTSGCIAIPEENMKLLMQMLREDCVIVIDRDENIMNY